MTQQRRSPIQHLLTGGPPSGRLTIVALRGLARAKDNIVIFRKPSSPAPATVAASGQGAVGVGGSVNAPITTSVVTNHNVILPAHEASWPVCVGVVPAR